LALYLFGVVRSGMAGRGSGLPALEPEAATSAVTCGALCAVVVETDAALFTGPGGDERLADLKWIGPRAVRHQEVLGTLLSSGPVLPARFGTLFSGEERLRAFLERHEVAISTFLDSTEGASEWGVRGVLDRPRALEALVADGMPPDEALATLSPGRRYLEERRLRSEAEQRLQRWVEETTSPLVTELAALSRATRSRTPSRAGDAAPGEETAFSWALLVDAGAEDRLRTAVAEGGASLAAKGLRLELSGPWPPYTFCPELED